MWKTGCIVAGLGQAANGIVSQGLAGLTLNGNGNEQPVGSNDGSGSDFVSDVLPYVGAAVGVTGIAAGVVVVAMKKSGNTASPNTHPSHKSNQMGYFDSKGNPPNARTIQL